MRDVQHSVAAEILRFKFSVLDKGPQKRVVRTAENIQNAANRGVCDIFFSDDARDFVYGAAVSYRTVVVYFDERLKCRLDDFLAFLIRD